MARQKAHTGGQRTRAIKFGDEAGLDYGRGEEFVGYFCGTKPVETKFGPKIVHKFQIPVTGEDVEIWGSADLNYGMKKIGLGNRTFITYVGEEETKVRGKSPKKLFSIDQDPADRIELTVEQISFRDDSSSSESSDDDVGYEGEYEAPSRAAPVPAAKPMATTPSSANRAKVAALLNRTKV